MITESTNIHTAAAHVWQAAEKIRQANHISMWRKHSATDAYRTVGALYELLSRLPQLVHHLADSLTHISPDSCYHDNGGNIAATMDTITTHLIHTQSNIAAITIAHSDLCQAHEHLAHLGLKITHDPDDYADNLTTRPEIDLRGAGR